MLPTEGVYNDNTPVFKAGGGKTTILKHRPTQTMAISHKQRRIKIQQKINPYLLSNMVAPTTNCKKLESADGEADDVWTDLANEHKQPRIKQTEFDWKDQDITMFATSDREIPYIMIVEQPEPGYRFRYGSEAGVVSLLRGVNSSKTVRTYTMIKVMNFVKKKYKTVDIFVSCVTHDDPQPIVHPYLIKNNKRKKGTNCSNGVCHVTMLNDDDSVEFADIGIQRVKTGQIEKSLADRREMRIDPFNQGYKYKHSQYDKEALKLCFQVYLTDIHGRRVLLQPVTSNTISFTKSKGMSLLSVTPNEASSEKSVKLTLFAENLPRAGDIHVMFYTSEWSCSVLPEYQHHDCGLHVLLPKLDVKITENTRVKIKLFRISNKTATEPLDFFIFPPKRNQQCLPSSSTKDLQEQIVCNRTNESRADRIDQKVKMLGNSPKTNEDLNMNSMIQVTVLSNDDLHNAEVTTDSELPPSVITPACNSPPLLLSSSHQSSATDLPQRHQLNGENLENVWDSNNLSSDASTHFFLHPGLDMMDYI